MKIVWRGTGLNEKGYWNNKPIIKIDKRYFRPTEVNSLKGDFSLAKKELRWKPKYKILDLVNEMVTEELKYLNVK
jgi:GDPmannose 4,6-dehydratase